MGQEEVKKELKKSREWMLSHEIAKKTGQSLTSVQAALRRMVKWGDVQRKNATDVIVDSGRLAKKCFAGFAYKLSSRDKKDEPGEEIQNRGRGI